jgi:hypothetical protein
MSEILGILMEAYLEILFISVLNLMGGKDDPDNNLFNIILSSVFLFLLLLVIPVCFGYLMLQSPKTLEKKSFSRRWHEIYSGLRFNKLALSYRYWFCFRRIIFISSVFLAKNHPFVQVMLLFYCNLIITIYFGITKPYKDRFANMIELFNELQITFICYFTLIFTDYVPTVEQQYSGGFMMIYLVITLLAANMLIVLR